jgi:hypothetical protein
MTNYSITKSLHIIRTYLRILNKNERFEVEKSYFIVLHNFLMIEQLFLDEIKLNNKEILVNLKLREVNDINNVLIVFAELYDINSKVRNNVETLDSIEPIRIYLSNKPNIYNELLNSETFILI